MKEIRKLSKDEVDENPVLSQIMSGKELKYCIKCDGLRPTQHQCVCDVCMRHHPGCPKCVFCQPAQFHVWCQDDAVDSDAILTEVPATRAFSIINQYWMTSTTQVSHCDKTSVWEMINRNTPDVDFGVDVLKVSEQKLLPGDCGIQLEPLGNLRYDREVNAGNFQYFIVEINIPF